MKRILILLIIALSVCMTGCYTNVIDLDDEGGGNGNNTKLVIADRTQLNQQIFAESRVCEVNFRSQTGWNVNFMDNNEAQSWIAFSPSIVEYGGEHTLSINVDENSTGAHRTATLRLYSGGQSETITINQSGKLSDGSTPPPYEKESYTDIVERVSVQAYTYDVIESSWSTEWRFVSNPETGEVYTMRYFLINYENEEIEQEINNNGFMIDHAFFGFVSQDSYEVIRRQHHQVVLNGCNFIIHQDIKEFDYQNGANPEPIRREVTHRYSAYRRVSERDEWITNDYRWEDGNMVEQKQTQNYSEESITRFTYTYRTELNDRTNIDLNALLGEDVYAAIGLLGKRSKNLLSSITDAKAGVTFFEYSFDAKGRVETITLKRSFDGNIDSFSTVFTVHYANDNGGDNDDNGSK